MNKTFVKSIILVALCTLALSGEAFAKGGSGGGVSSGSALRTHTMTQTKVETQTQTKTQVKSRQQLRDGSAVAGSSAQGGSQGEKGHFGVADGTDTPLQPLDGTGLGSPTNR
jgi:hypothetical protein